MLYNGFSHRFFYNEGQDYQSRGPLSFDRAVNRFYSYYTCIALIYDDHLILSNNNMTPTTSKHINDLRRASPLPVIYAAFRYGQHYVKIEDVIKWTFEDMKNAKNAGFNKKENREEFLNAYNSLQQLKKLKGIKIKGLAPYTRIYNNMESYVTAAKSATRRKAAEARAKLEALCKTHNITELARRAYSEYSDEARKLRKKINPSGDLAFIWRDGDYIRTSKNISMLFTTAAAAFKKWMAGGLSDGDKIEYYEFKHGAPDGLTVRVGCHLMLVKNLLEVFKNEY